MVDSNQHQSKMEVEDCLIYKIFLKFLKIDDEKNPENKKQLFN